MSSTAFDAMLALARIVVPTTEGTATSGSATTILDTDILGVHEWLADDGLNGGTAFITYDAGGAGAAPQNETARITDYAESISTVTLMSGDLSAAAAAGDGYAVTSIPRYQLYAALNAALRDLGDVPYENDTSLDTVADTREYTLPAAAKRDLRQVWIAQHTAAPWDYAEQNNWRVIKNRATLDLVFSNQPTASRNIRLVYVGPHATLDDDADTVNDAVPFDYLVWRGAFHVYLRRLQQEGRNAEQWTGLMNMAAEYASQALQRHPIQLPRYGVRFFQYDEPSAETPGAAHIQTADVPTS